MPGIRGAVGWLDAAMLLVGGAAIAGLLGSYGLELAPASLERPPSGPASGKDLPSVLSVIEETILETDTDGDGVPDVSDCRPLDETLWGIPSAVTDLTITGDALATLDWSEPADPGGETVFYDLLMSGSGGIWPASGTPSAGSGVSGPSRAASSPGSGRSARLLRPKYFRNSGVVL